MKFLIRKTVGIINFLYDEVSAAGMGKRPVKNAGRQEGNCNRHISFFSAHACLGVLRETGSGYFGLGYMQKQVGNRRLHGINQPGRADADGNDAGRKESKDEKFPAADVSQSGCLRGLG